LRSLNSFLLKCIAVGALGGLLFGFDTAVIAGTTHALTALYHLSPGELGFTVSSALWGTVLGAALSGMLGDKLGRRNALRILAACYIASALGCAFALDWPMLILFRFIGGLGIGGSSVLGPVYIAEIAPAQWRGRLVGCFQINIVVGILVAYLSNFLIGLAGFGANEWRWQLGITAGPAVLFLAMLFGIPQSPRWLVTKNRIAEAGDVLTKLRSGTGSHVAAFSELKEILDSVHPEKLKGSEELFQLKYLRPIFLAVSVAMFNQLAGVNAILYYLNDIFAMAGFGKISSDLQAVAIGAMNLLATLLAMILIDRIGRRMLLLIGSVGLAISLAGISLIFLHHQHQNWLVYLLVGYIGFFAVSQGAVIWVFIGEVLPDISKPTSNPSIMPRCFCTSASGISLGFTARVAPILRASSSRKGFMSVITTCRAPAWRTTGIAMMPMGPAPVMSTSSPSTGNESAVWTALPKGSKMAATS
jgi:SP family arabinose:H+ symporter-like MFS transporter